MEKLLHHYELQLERLRQSTRQYAEAYPATAAALELGPDASTDPEVERLLQSVALLNACMQMRIEDGRSEFHKALLQTLQPHYLRPLPSCGIVQVDVAAWPSDADAVARLPRGTVLHDGAYRFATAYEVCVSPIAIAQARFQPTIDAPASLRLPPTAASAISVTLGSMAGSVTFDAPPLPRLRVCIDGEPGQRASLTDALLMRSLCLCLEAEGHWKVLPASLFSPAGMGDAESLLPVHPGAQAPRLLSEYSHLPRKFDFFDLDLAALAAHVPPRCGRITLHAVLPNLLKTRHAAALRQLTLANLRLACTPVINLFPMTAQPIRLDGRGEPYAVTPSQPDCEIYSIDRVGLMNRAADIVFRPFHGLDHSSNGPFWLLDEQEGISIRLTDREQRPYKLDDGTIVPQLTCTNGDMARPGGKLATEATIGGLPIRFLDTPVPPYRFRDARPLCEAIQSNDTSLAALRTMLQLHGCNCADALKRLSIQAATAWMDLPAGRVHMQGSEYTLAVDEAMLRESSLFTLARMLEQLLAARTRANRFIRLCLVQDNGPLIHCGQPRTGNQRIA